MAWTDPATGPAVTGTVAPASLWNTFVRDNLEEVGEHRRILKTTDSQVVNNSTTLVSDNQLKIAMLANEVWLFKFHVMSDGPAAGDFKIALNSPTGSLGNWGVIGEANSGQLIQAGGTSSVGGGQFVDANTSVLIESQNFIISGGITNGSTAGDLQLRWAQNTATVGDTRVLYGSSLVCHRVGG